jgi:phosphoglycerol transferase MdoB-like AlkP superfamily enzyme
MLVLNAAVPDRGDSPLRVPVRPADLGSLKRGIADGLRRAAPVLLSLVVAFLASLTLSLVDHNGDVRALIEQEVLMVPLLTVLGTSLVWATLVGVWAIVGRLSVGVALFAVATGILAFANHLKLDLRLEPVLPSDLVYVTDLGFLFEMVGATQIALVVLTLAILVLGAGAWWWLSRRRAEPNANAAGPRWRNLVGRALVLASSVSFLGYAADFNGPGNELRRAYEAAGAHWAVWDQALNYQRNGFVGGLLYNLDVAAMKPPPGYSAAAMDALVRRYTEAAATMNRRRSATLDDVNVVVALSESFSDPTRLRGIDFEEDPIPFTRRMMDGTTSGTMLAQKFGGGTADMEFETLTGMSKAQFSPQVSIAYQMIVPNYESFPSAVQLFKDRGHGALAIHPFTTGLYRRESVYPIFGFDDFISQGELQHEERVDDNEFISDDSAFDEVRYQISRSDEPLLINLVTMQNHYPTDGKYHDPIPLTGLTGISQASAEGYLRGLSHSDKALRTFLDELRTSDEKTAVVFYGDHLPPFWSAGVRKLNGAVAMHSTPYFVWANFPLEQLPREKLTSPIFFLPMLFEAADAEVTPYYALLTLLHDRITAMGSGKYVERGVGTVQESQLSPPGKRLLRDYRMVQYDLSVGPRHAAEALLGEVPGTATSSQLEALTKATP